MPTTPNPKTAAADVQAMGTEVLFADSHHTAVHAYIASALAALDTAVASGVTGDSGATINKLNADFAALQAQFAAEKARWDTINLVPGATGATGAVGPQGKSVSVTVGATAPGTATNGDIWINGNDASIFGSGLWVSLHGQDGSQGPRGTDGISVRSASAAELHFSAAPIANFDSRTGNIAFGIPRGVPGVPFTFRGELSSKNLLPSPTGIIGESYTVNDGVNPYLEMFISDGTRWIRSAQLYKGVDGAQGPRGADGLNAFDTWKLLTARPSASLIDFLKAITGPAGAKGERGPAGETLKVQGIVANEAGLPANPPPLTVLVAQDTITLYVFDPTSPVAMASGWVSMGRVQGPPGPAAWLGPKVATRGALPPAGGPGEYVLVEDIGHLFGWSEVTNTWIDGGKIVYKGAEILPWQATVNYEAYSFVIHNGMLFFASKDIAASDNQEPDVRGAQTVTLRVASSAQHSASMYSTERTDPVGGGSLRIETFGFKTTDIPQMSFILFEAPSAPWSPQTGVFSDHTFTSTESWILNTGNPNLGHNGYYVLSRDKINAGMSNAEDTVALPNPWTGIKGYGELFTDGSNKMLAPLNMGTFPIQNVANPTFAKDAATKQYVDDYAADLAETLVRTCSVRAFINSLPGTLRYSVYIVGADSNLLSGELQGREGELVWWDDIAGKWNFFEPADGEAHFVEDDLSTWQYARATSTWSKVATSGTDNVVGSYGVGEITMFPSIAIPDGYLVCDGRQFNAVAFPELYAYLKSDNVPDLRGRFIRGWSVDSTVDANGPRAALSLQDDTTRMPRNNPFTGVTNQAGQHGHGFGHGTAYITQSTTGHNLDPGSTGAHEGVHTFYHDGQHAHNVSITGGDSETRPKNVALVFAIRSVAIAAGPRGPVGQNGRDGTEVSMVGDLKESLLTEAQFTGLLAPSEVGRWVLADGRSVAGSTYAKVTGATKVPDLRGAYLRMAGQNASNPSWAGGAVGTFQEDATRAPRTTAFTGTTSQAGSHQHIEGGTHWHLSDMPWGGVNATNGVSGPLPHEAGWRHPYTGSAGDHTHSITVGGGDTETRPKSFMVNYYIKID